MSRNQIILPEQEHIHKIISKYHNSNNYLIETTNKLVVIDPGDPDISDLHSCIIKLNKSVEAVLLTHEHSDHCVGVNKLRGLFNFDLYCTNSCSVNIKNSKQNFSYYIDIINEFTIEMPSIIVKDKECLTIDNCTFTFIETPGHSPGSACILCGNAVFTGDTLLNGIKTPLSFPHSNREMYTNSIKKLQQVLKPGMTIYPGHGDAFTWNTLQT